MTLAALIPAYCEEKHLGAVAAEVRGQADAVLVVDDGSPDGTATVAKAAGAEVLRHEKNSGKGAALKSGFRHLWARGFDAVVMLDGDGQHLPEEIARFRAAAEGDPTIGLWVGNRMTDLRVMPPVRRATNRFMSGLLSRVAGQRIPDSQCGFRLMRRSVAELLTECEASAFDYESEMLIRISRAGHAIGAVPVSTVYRDEVSSIRPARDTIRFARLLWRHARGGKPRGSRMED